MKRRKLLFAAALVICLVSAANWVKNRFDSRASSLGTAVDQQPTPEKSSLPVPGQVPIRTETSFVRKSVRDLTEKEKAYASTFSTDRRSGHEAEWVVEAFYPELYKFMLVEAKALRSADDLKFQESFLESATYLEVVREILTHHDEFAVSNTGEYARLYAIKSLRKALALQDHPQMEALGDLLSDSLTQFPESALANQDLKNSFSVDYLQIYMLLNNFFPEKVDSLKARISGEYGKHLIEIYESDPKKFEYLARM